MNMAIENLKTNLSKMQSAEGTVKITEVTELLNSIFSSDVLDDGSDKDWKVINSMLESSFHALYEWDV